MKYGRLAPRHTLRTMRGALAIAKAYAPLGAPPSISADYVSAVDKATGGNWRLDGNSQYGDCTIADCAHQIMLHTANAGSIVIPTTAECTGLYFRLTGGPDTGLDETTVCDAMQTIGLAGQKSAGSGMLDPARLDHIRWTMQIFGACRLGITIDQRFQNEFSSGLPWAQAADPNSPTIGGHDVPVVGYDQDHAYVVTWGRLQAVTWALMADAQFLEEAHCEVWADWVRQGDTAPSGFDLVGLLAEMPAVEAA